MKKREAAGAAATCNLPDDLCAGVAVYICVCVCVCVCVCWRTMKTFSLFVCRCKLKGDPLSFLMQKRRGVVSIGPNRSFLGFRGKEDT